ncbi:MAG: hypothetical protein EOO15_11580 [Chitinophagaceae bacterium]|nr:MAG: hypothetical protein EOO15_11580 [Chitinophagaceae bacterium]
MLAYSISVWARGHKGAARLLLVVSLLLLNVTAWIAGNLLAASGFEQAGGLVLLFSLIGAVFLLAYPARGARFSHRKAFDGALAGCTFVLVMLLSAAPVDGPLPFASNNAQAASVSAGSEAPPRYKKMLRKLARQIRGHYRDGDDAKKTLLILLTVIVGILLIGVVLALACSIACSGAEVIAIIVGALGITGIVIGAISIIRRIVKGPRKKAEAPKEPAG